MKKVLIGILTLISFATVASEHKNTTPRKECHLAVIKAVTDMPEFKKALREAAQKNDFETLRLLQSGQINLQVGACRKLDNF